MTRVCPIDAFRTFVEAPISVDGVFNPQDSDYMLAWRSGSQCTVWDTSVSWTSIAGR